MGLEIIKAGMLTTVQDQGRRGYAALGFRECGACDKYAMKTANLLAGNLDRPGFHAVLEFTMSGGTLRFTEPEIFALAGADMSPALNGSPISMYRPVVAKPGDLLSLGPARRGLRLYLALYGGILVPEVMGSRSTDLNCHIGGLEGRALKPGDFLKSGATSQERWKLASVLRGREERWALKPEEQWLRLPSSPCRLRDGRRFPVLRTVAGPQEEAFTAGGRADFVSAAYRLSGKCDRMACRLEGRKVEMKKPPDILSDGIVEGSIQVASDGLPMVMLADHQTAGGYAKIGTVITTDIPVLAQLRPGDQVIFEFVDPMEGIRACRKEEKKLAWLAKRLEKESIRP